MEKISCEIISDLLPLYCDDVCTPDSRRLIEDHLADCPGCRNTLEQLYYGYRIFQEQEQQDEITLKTMASLWKKSVWKSFVIGILAASCILLLVFAGWWGLTRWPLVTVPPDAVSADAEISGSDFAIHMKMINGYKSTSADIKITEDGKLFICLKRGIIPVKNGNGTSLDGVYSAAMTTVSETGKTVQIQEIYYGTEKIHKLLWKK